MASLVSTTVNGDLKVTGSSNLFFEGSASSNTFEPGTRIYGAGVTLTGGAYTSVFEYTVPGGLAGNFRFFVKGTTGNVVIPTQVDVLLNHSKDITIKSQTGNYTPLHVKVLTNDNEDCLVQIKADTSGNANVTVYIDVIAFGDGSVSFSSFGSYTGTSLEHRCAFGFAFSTINGTTSTARFVMEGNHNGGRLGVGTDDPDYMVDVRSTANDARVTVRTTAAGAYFRANSGTAGYAALELQANGSGAWALGQYGYNDFSIIQGAINGTRRLTINTDGNVGIGITNPSALLEVGNDGNTDYALIGPTKIGGGFGHGDYAGFSHRDRSTTTSYALLQHTAGTTYLNSNVRIYMGVNNANYTAQVESDRFQVNNALKLNDNSKIKIGNSDDLEIYHNSADSFISDVGTGNLVISGSGVWVKNAAIDANQIGCVEGSSGYVKLYQNGNEKLATASTGVSVTGTLQVTPAASEQGITIGDASKGEVPLIFKGGSGSHSIGQNGAGFFISATSTGNLDTNERFQIDSTGSIVLGVPTNSLAPATTTTLKGYSVQYDTGGAGERLSNTGFLIWHTGGSWTGNERMWAFTNADNMGGGGGPRFTLLRGNANDVVPTLGNNGSLGTNTLRTCYWTKDGDFYNSGSVGIRTETPAANLHIYEATTDTPLQITRAANTGNAMIKFETGSTDDWIVGLRNDSTSNFRIYSYGTSSDVFSINRTDGNVGIGTTTPEEKLHIVGNLTFTPANNRGIYFNTTSGQEVYIRSKSGSLGEIQIGSDNKIEFVETDANSLRFLFDTNSGTFTPGSNGYDLGSTSKRWEFYGTSGNFSGTVTAGGIALGAGNLTTTGDISGNGSGLTALNASNIGSGTVPAARLGSGTASSSTYLRGDNTWAAVSGGSGMTTDQYVKCGFRTAAGANDGGSITADTWTTRDISYTWTNNGSFATVSTGSNWVTLDAGDYYAIFRANAVDNDHGQARLETDGGTVLVRSNNTSAATDSDQFPLIGAGHFTLASQDNVLVKQISENTQATFGLGRNLVGIGATYYSYNVYFTLEIWKIG
jgi:hypothetical protein